FLKLISIGLITSAAACSGNNTNRHLNNKSDSINAGKSIVTDAAGDSVINLVFPAGDSTAVVLGKLEGPGKHITVHVPVQNQNKLTASLTPLDSLSNIRFNQIIYPDGKKDGPFGREISIGVQQNRSYQL